MSLTEIVVQQLINGVSLGAMYALLALGFTLVYGIMELINFSHFNVFMVGSFIAMGVLRLLGVSGQGVILAGLPLVGVLLAAFIATIVSSGFLGVLIERVSLRPLRRVGGPAAMITTLGVSYILSNTIMLSQGAAALNFPNPIPAKSFEIFGAVIQMREVLILIVSFVMMIALKYFIERSKMGKAMRASAQDPDAARMMGVEVDRVIMTAFFISSALAGAAGLIFGLYYNFTSFLIGFTAGIRAFTAAVLGGIGNIQGAVVGGFLIGIIEAMASQFIGAKWSDALVFGILVAVLVFFPSGMFGRVVPNKS